MIQRATDRAREAALDEVAEFFRKLPLPPDGSGFRPRDVVQVCELLRQRPVPTLPRVRRVFFAGQPDGECVLAADTIMARARKMDAPSRERLVVALEALADYVAALAKLET